MKNCPCCNKLLRKVQDTTFTRQSYMQCDYHGSVRVWYQSVTDGAYNIILVLLYRDTTYHATFIHNNPGLDHKFQITKPKRYPKTSELILTLDFHPDITPENIEKKLPTMILFS